MAETPTTDTVLVRPWPGLILDGIPATGAPLPKALAEEWIADRLVVRVAPAPVLVESKPDSRTLAKPGDPRASKQRRTT